MWVSWKGLGLQLSPTPPQAISDSLWSPPLSRPSPWPHKMVNHHLGDSIGTVSFGNNQWVLHQFIHFPSPLQKKAKSMDSTHTHTATPAAQPISLASVISLKPSFTVLRFSNYLPGFYLFYFFKQVSCMRRRLYFGLKLLCGGTAQREEPGRLFRRKNCKKV